MIQLHDKKFEVFISGEEINFAIENMAKQIEDDFCDDVPVFIGVLNGSFMVVADLLKKYIYNCEVSFVKMASYEGTQTTNEVKQLIGVNQNLEGRSVVIVEDIVDTGNTIEDTAGCPLCGFGFQLIQGDYRVTQSVMAYQMIYPKLVALAKNKANKISIENNFQF